MDTLEAAIALLSAEMPGWDVREPAPAGLTAVEGVIPPTVIVEETGGQEPLGSPRVTATYRLRFLAPSGVQARAGVELARAIGRNPATGLARGGRIVTVGQLATPRYLAFFWVGRPAGPLYDPELGTPTVVATATARWDDLG